MLLDVQRKAPVVPQILLPLVSTNSPQNSN
jgi:hypothetical protein